MSERGDLWDTRTGVNITASDILDAHHMAGEVSVCPTCGAKATGYGGHATSWTSGIAQLWVNGARDMGF